MEFPAVHPPPELVGETCLAPTLRRQVTTSRGPLLPLCGGCRESQSSHRQSGQGRAWGGSLLRQCPTGGLTSLLTPSDPTCTPSPGMSPASKHQPCDSTTGPEVATLGPRDGPCGQTQPDMSPLGFQHPHRARVISVGERGPREQVPQGLVYGLRRGQDLGRQPLALRRQEKAPCSPVSPLRTPRPPLGPNPRPPGTRVVHSGPVDCGTETPSLGSGGLWPWAQGWRTHFQGPGRLCSPLTSSLTQPTPGLHEKLACHLGQRSPQRRSYAQEDSSAGGRGCAYVSVYMCVGLYVGTYKCACICMWQWEFMCTCECVFVYVCVWQRNMAVSTMARGGCSGPQEETGPSSGLGDPRGFVSYTGAGNPRRDKARRPGDPVLQAPRSRGTLATALTMQWAS